MNSLRKRLGWGGDSGEEAPSLPGPKMQARMEISRLVEREEDITGQRLLEFALQRELTQCVVSRESLSLPSIDMLVARHAYRHHTQIMSVAEHANERRSEVIRRSVAIHRLVLSSITEDDMDYPSYSVDNMRYICDTLDILQGKEIPE